MTARPLAKLKASLTRLDVNFSAADQLLKPESTRKKTTSKCQEVLKRLEQSYYKFEDEYCAYKDTILTTGVTEEAFNAPPGDDGDKVTEFNDAARELKLASYLDVTDRLEDLIDDLSTVEDASKAEDKTALVQLPDELELETTMESLENGIKDVGNKIESYGDKSIGMIQAQTIQQLLQKFEEQISSSLMSKLPSPHEPEGQELRKKVNLFSAEQIQRLNNLTLLLQRRSVVTILPLLLQCLLHLVGLRSLMREFIWRRLDHRNLKVI